MGNNGGKVVVYTWVLWERKAFCSVGYIICTIQYSIVVII